MTDAERSQQKKKILAELASTPIVEIACKKAGIHRSTFYRWCEQDHLFRDNAEQIRLESIWAVNDLAESKIIARVKNDDYKATTFWLKHNHHHYYQRGHDRKTVPYPTHVSSDPLRYLAFQADLQSISIEQDATIVRALKTHWQTCQSWFQDCINHYKEDPHMLLKIQKAKKLLPEEEFSSLVELFKEDRKKFEKEVKVLVGED